MEQYCLSLNKERKEGQASFVIPLALFGFPRRLSVNSNPGSSFTPKDEKTLVLHCKFLKFFLQGFHLGARLRLRIAAFLKCRKGCRV
jgi:hypothetical protein